MKSDDILRRASELVNLAPTSIAEWSVVIVGHLKDDGHQAFAYFVTDHAPASQVVYALEGIKLDAISLTIDKKGRE
jgi:hypothetical protein